LAHEPPSTGAERRAHRQLALTRRPACEQEIRDVHASDDEHERHRPKQDPQRANELLADHPVAQRDGGHGHPGPLGGELSLDRNRERAELRARLVERPIGAQARQTVEDEVVRRHVARVGCAPIRVPHLDVARKLHALWEDADDGGWKASDAHRLPDHIGRSPELLLPKAVRQHERPWRPGLELIGQR
jgi:hypothetical protein